MELSSSDSPNLLLIDNSEDHAILFQRIFAKVARHWQFDWVKDGSAAVHRMVHDRIPNLLVTSLQTPRLDAVDVIEWIRSIKCPHPVTVMIFDAVPQEAIHQRLLDLGVKDYLDRRSPGEKFRQILIRLVAEAESHAMDTPPLRRNAKGSTPGFARTHHL